MTTRRAVSFAISILLAVLLLGWFLQGLDLAAVGQAFRSAHAGWLLAAVVLSIAIVPLRAWRWTRLLHRLGKIPQLEANGATFIGFAATTLLPARAGEIVRPVYLAQRCQKPVAPLLASIALERLLDLLMVLLLFVLFALGWAPDGLAGDEASRLALLRRSAILMGVVAGVGIGVMAFLAARPQLFERLLSPLLGRLPEKLSVRLTRLLHSFLDGLSGMRTKGDVAAVAASSVALWLLISLQVHAVLRAFSIEQPFPVAFFVIAWSVIGLAIPTPGGVGGYHAAVAYSLTGFYGVASSTAKALALAAHAIAFGPVTLIGLLFLAAGGASLRSLSEAPAEAETEKTTSS